MQGLGGATIGPPSLWPVTDATVAFVVADFDADGHADTSVEGYATDEFAVRLGDGAGGFGTLTTCPIAGWPQDMIAADLDLDGRSTC